MVYGWGSWEKWGEIANEFLCGVIKMFQNSMPVMAATQ